MEIFSLRNKLVKDYADFIKSFIIIRDKQISNCVEDELEKGLLWPDPLIQLNPTFKPGDWIDDLVDREILHDECSTIFRIKEGPNDGGKPLRLHRHQSDALKAAKTGGNYVLTTGTGSGKSLAYIVPIVNHVLENGSGKGIQAIIVYPMNALCNSQYGELQKFLCHGYPEASEPVKFARYTGQERDEERGRIIADPPDILLTNYMMLELILTRPSEKNLIEASQGLRFLVLDELHTYRGRQGADVSMLVRRVRKACDAENLQCIGTSATIAGPGTYNEQKQEIAKVASKLFGSDVKPEMVIGETLRRATPDIDLEAPAFVDALRKRLSDSKKPSCKEFDDFIKDPMSVWIESTFGVAKEEGSGRLLRAVPKSITGDKGAAKLLQKSAGEEITEDTCVSAIEECLLAGYQCKHPETGFPVFAFRLHQFISRGDNVYATLEPPEERFVTVYGQKYKPGDRSRILLPTVFCRECGQEYYCVRAFKDPETNQKIFQGRDLSDRLADEDSEAGFLFHNPKTPWPDDANEILERVPNEWLEENRGLLKLKKNYAKYLPEKIFIAPDGKGADEGLAFHYLKAPFRFCLACGVSYGARQVSDFGKLTALGTEGRSTATTILSLSAVRHLQNEKSLPSKARKLLSFTDNRQDASLQAGHFNDFVEVGLLRSALFKASKEAGPEGLRHDEITHRVFEALDLPMELYAADPGVKFNALEETKKALKNVIGYRLYHDLRRGWRVTSPNLEQCGLLQIDYLSLQELCEAEEEWSPMHQALVSATPSTRQKICKVLLDLMRRELAIKVDYLQSGYQERIRQQSSQRLKPPWAMDENERMVESAILFPRSRKPKDHGGFYFLSPRGLYGQYLRRKDTLPDHGEKLNLENTKEIIAQLLQVLKVAGLVEEVVPPREDNSVPGYQLPGSAIRWVAGDGSQTFLDPLRVPTASDYGAPTNPFFTRYYKEMADEGKGIEAKEHTAQVPYPLRAEREECFREGRLPILYCSPTMELGIDIATLNIVNMRNIPPTPANYAQRSGRAGRSGQPALVFSYCSTGSPHDQYFFKRPERMVAGAVAPPKLEMGNEDLVKAHVHAIWLAATGQSLGSSLREVLNVSGEKPSLDLLESVKESFDSEKAKKEALRFSKDVLESIREELESAGWYSEGWVDEVLNRVVLSFEEACRRWRSLYKAAESQRNLQNKIIGDASRKPADRKQAKRLRREAEAQLELLLESRNVIHSDFYSYRYFASEGFLPGYNFPRLPLSAYIPGRRGRADDFLSRPRFLAISEFGPRSMIYHEGSRYIVNKVILPVGDAEQDKDILTTSAKICSECGYLHPVSNEDPGLDLCEYCKSGLDRPLTQLFRMQNASAKRRDRINCDEEERLRLGYEIKTGIRFAVIDGKPSIRNAVLKSPDETPLAMLKYGHSATLWRINMGWSRRKNKSQRGFVLDTERGYWARNEQTSVEDEVDPMSPVTRRVIPFVEDCKNCLIFEPCSPLDESHMASLQAALKKAVQATYQLEDSELAAEPLPDRNNRKFILFYEAAEGGAGVLRQMIADPDAFSAVAAEALELCHFDPGTGEDLKRAPLATEDCEAACYDCLLTYSNQRDHEILDRRAVKDLLLQYKDAVVSTSPSSMPRAEHLKQLSNLSGSSLEKDWLQFLEENDLNLPSEAQTLFKMCESRPDFFYKSHMAIVYIDGPVHEFPERAERDKKQAECLEDMGYSVIRFTNRDNWKDNVAKYPHVFGTCK